RHALACILALTLPQRLFAQSSTDMEFFTDRPGMDYKDYAVGDPELCQAACANESRCAAYTYVKPGVQGAAAHCWLKSGVPNPVQNECCISGVAKLHIARPPAFIPMDTDVDRPGGDYRDFGLPEPNPELCQTACANEFQCRAYTYVKPDAQGGAA